MLNFLQTMTVAEFKSAHNLTSVSPKIHGSGKTSFTTSNPDIQGKGSPTVVEVLNSGNFDTLRISLCKDDLLGDEFYMLHVADSSKVFTL